MTLSVYPLDKRLRLGQGEKDVPAFFSTIVQVCHARARVTRSDATVVGVWLC